MDRAFFGLSTITREWFPPPWLDVAPETSFLRLGPLEGLALELSELLLRALDLAVFPFSVDVVRAFFLGTVYSCLSSYGINSWINPFRPRTRLDASVFEVALEKNLDTIHREPTVIRPRFFPLAA
jgi:hypothetical protein